VVVLIRGDLDVNEIKLTNYLDCTHLQLASEAKIQQVTGGPQGFSGPVGLADVRIIADPTVMELETAATGANRADTHLVGVVPGRDFESGRGGGPSHRARRRSVPGAAARSTRSAVSRSGHIFKLGTKYSDAMRCVYLDDQGAEQSMIMGCYGLGVGRTVAAAVEQNHDDKGIIWPLPLAPYEVLLAVLNADKAEVVEAAEGLYERLREAGIDVLFDDRPERPGVKFNDMDLIGFPVRIVAGARGAEAEGNVEVSLRRDGEKTLVPVADLVPKVQELLAELRAELS
jgi:prolyl-tRNA synthetase